MEIVGKFGRRRGRLSRVLALTSAGAVFWAIGSLPTAAQTSGQPHATLKPASPLAFPAQTDSNSPVVWDLIDGELTVSVLNSVDGQTRVSRGSSLASLEDFGSVSFSTAAPPGGYWFEAIVQDAGAWYGFYHNEVSDVVCPESGKVWAQIGAARSTDYGLTWVDLGPLLGTPAGDEQCDTLNDYFVGGSGDFAALLDADSTYLYLYYTQYAERDDAVGVAVARMVWAHRDSPGGQLDVWSDGAWLPPTTAADPSTAQGPWLYPLASPILLARDSWDQGSPAVDVFWGPAVHWNTHIKTYVMLLNRATSAGWKQGGIYIAYNDDISDPEGWTAPVSLLSGGEWYPQVVGLGSHASDTYAGSPSRFFMSGHSDSTIVFERR